MRISVTLLFMSRFPDANSNWYIYAFVVYTHTHTYIGAYTWDPRERKTRSRAKKNLIKMTRCPYPGGKSISSLFQPCYQSPPPLQPAHVTSTLPLSSPPPCIVVATPRRRSPLFFTVHPAQHPPSAQLTTRNPRRDPALTRVPLELFRRYDACRNSVIQ